MEIDVNDKYFEIEFDKEVFSKKETIDQSEINLEFKSDSSPSSVYQVIREWIKLIKENKMEKRGQLYNE